MLSGYRPNQATGMRQAGYKMQFTSGVTDGSGWEAALRDPVPCLTNTSEWQPGLLLERAVGRR